MAARQELILDIAPARRVEFAVADEWVKADTVAEELPTIRTLFAELGKYTERDL